jgi:hypothetical protein
VVQTPQAVAERVVRAWRHDQDLHVEPEHQAALIIPSTVVAELGLEEAAFDEVARLWDEAISGAVAQVVTRARNLAA